MVQRISEGRSPFSADKNHIHHKLLALGFHQYEALALIYFVQASLFVVAYLMGYEHDLFIIGVVTLFFIGTITSLQIAIRTGWRIRKPEISGPSAGTPIAHFRRGVRLLPRASYLAIVIPLGTHAITIVAEDSPALSGDLSTLLIALVIVLLGIMRDAPLTLIEKAVLYVTATVLVYLDAFILPLSKEPLHNNLDSGIDCDSGSRHSFADFVRATVQITPLDLIVLFMALVVPNISGSLGLPHGGALAIAKLVIVFYAVEMLIDCARRQAMWMRLATASVLASLTVRSLLLVH
jgi:UDP-GlcNAc:undecaprenyl-phosphate GlcNAc-1-phosphate transferase